MDACFQWMMIDFLVLLYNPYFHFRAILRFCCCCILVILLLFKCVVGARSTAVSAEGHGGVRGETPLVFIFFFVIVAFLHCCVANELCRGFVFHFFFIFVLVCDLLLGSRLRLVIGFLCCCLLLHFAVVWIRCGCEMHHGSCVDCGGARGEFPCASFVIAADSRVLGVFRDSAQVADAGPPRVTSPRGPLPVLPPLCGAASMRALGSRREGGES